MNPIFLLVSLCTAQPAGPTSGVLDVLAARSVTFGTPHPYPWAKDHAPLTEGTVLVLQVEPALVVPRQVGVPVLFVGDTPVERINTGWPSGRLVVLVPGDVDLATAPAWFGSTELPERVDEERGRAELDAALAAGFQPLCPTRLLAVRGPDLLVADSDAFYRAVADLIVTWAPDEADRARQMQAPSVGR